MQTRQLGESDLRVSAIGLGTMTYGEQNSEAEAHQQLDHALAQGVNFIDCAEMYPVPADAATYGRAEKIVGSWLRRQTRDRVVLASKAAGPRRELGWIRGGPGGLDRENLRAALTASLQRLQTDYIDLYQLHWPERNVPMFGRYQFDPTHEAASYTSIHEQLEALAELVREGKVRYIGVSNETPWGVMEFLRLADQHHLPRIVSIQNCYNLLNRGYEFGLAEIGYRERLSLLAYSPLAFGHLSGKYQAGGSGRVTLYPGFAQRYEKPNVVPACVAYAALARKYGVSPGTLALAFVYQRWFVASTIIGATSMEQLQDNLAAWQQLAMSEELLFEIEQIHLRYMNPAP